MQRKCGVFVERFCRQLRKLGIVGVVGVGRIVFDGFRELGVGGGKRILFSRIVCS